MAKFRSQRPQSSPPSRADFWREHLLRCDASGQSAAAYCRDNGLSAPSFHWWKHKLNSSCPPPILFAEVAVESLPSREDAAVEILLTSGRVARVRPGFDAPTLARVLAVLEERPC